MKREDLNHVLVIGSGPIVIGQACEFDYSGTQACRVLKDEGLRVTLVNSNPATIMTDPEFADHTYVEPIEPSYIDRILAREAEQGHPVDAILPTLGGQTALNTAIKLDRLGILDKHGVELIGADIDAIERGDFAHLPGELGDLLFQVVYHARMAEEAEAFALPGGVDADGVDLKLRVIFRPEHGQARKAGHLLAVEGAQVEGVARGDLGAVRRLGPRAVAGKEHRLDGGGRRGVRDGQLAEAHAHGSAGDLGACFGGTASGRRRYSGTSGSGCAPRSAAATRPAGVGGW